MIARSVSEHVESGWIRRMYAEALEMKVQLGEENVFDYSLGNPSAPTPRAVSEALRRVASEQPELGHAYMPNAGYPQVRKAVAAQLRERTGLPYTADHIVMTVGAAGAVNVALRTVLDPGDEVIVPMPSFAEYPFYIANHAGHMVPVQTTADFQLDTGAIERALTDTTKAIILNSPNNPTGAVYSADSLQRLEQVLARHWQPVLVISDEPYRELIYPGVTVAEMPQHITCCAVAYSWSKTLGLAGERIGYLALSPRIPDVRALVAGCVFANRVLGFVNAPATWQWVIKDMLHVPADVEHYRRKVDLICGNLERIGYRLRRPDGGFYVFPETPIADDLSFLSLLRQEGILAVPGRSFGRPGHMRLSLTLSEEKINRSLPGFERAFHQAR